MIPQCKQKDNYEVIVSLAEPTGADRKKVWMQKGKNLFNKNDYLSYVWFNMEGTIYKTGDNHIITDFIKVKPNTQYTFSTNTSIYLNLRGYDINKNQTKIIFDAITQTITFTTRENTYFIRVGIGNGLNYLDNNIQIEQGPTATEYEAYVEPKMYVLNDNDVYEEFINAGTMEIETITNDNGTAIKFPDGTLIQRGNYSIEALEVNAGAGKDITLPVPFIDDTYSVSISKTSGGISGFAGVADACSRTNNILSVTHWNSVGHSEPINYCWTAIGRWK